MEGQLDERKEKYTSTKAMLDAAVRDRNDKAWDRAYAEQQEAVYALEIATNELADQKAI
jgi:hypothetical protein